MAKRKIEKLKDKKKSSKIKNNELDKDIVVLEEKDFHQPTATVFFIVVMCILILFLVLSNSIPFIVNNFEFLADTKNLKFYFILLIIPFALGFKIYFDYRKNKKMNLKL